MPGAPYEIIRETYDDEMETKPMSLKAICYLLYSVVATTLMMVLLRVWGKTAGQYGWFYSFSWAVGFCPFFTILLLLRRKGPKGFRHAPTSLDAPRPIILQSVFASFCYAINYLGVSTSTHDLPGPIQALLSQTPILITVIMSRIIMGKTYSKWTWLGAIIVFLSAIAVVFMENKLKSSVGIKPILLFLLGNIPLGFLPLGFEAFHKAKGADGKRITVELRLLVTNIFLILWLVAFIPLFSLFGSPPFKDINANFSAAFRCVFTGEGGIYKDNQCDVAGPVLLATVVVAAAQQHSQVLLSRFKTGVFAQLALSVAPYAADLIYPFSIFMGPFADAVSKWDGLGAGLGVIGVGIYIYFENKDKKTGRWKDAEEIPIVQFFLLTRWNGVRGSWRDAKRAAAAHSAAKHGVAHGDDTAATPLMSGVDEDGRPMHI